MKKKLLLLLHLLITTFFASAQNVGIGTTAPIDKLDVRGSTTDDGVVLSVGNADGSHKLGLFGGRLNDPNPFIKWKDGDPLRFATDLSGFNELMRIMPNGNVGIGTATPTLAKLQVQGMVGNTVAIFNGSTASQGISLVADWPGIYFNAYYDNLGIKSMAPTGYPAYIETDQSNGDLSFNLSTIANTTANSLITVPERMRITSTGKIGVGIITPKATLDIAASNITTPTNQDGILIPRISSFPASNPTIDQNGMMVFLTSTVGANLPGFYYWNNYTTAWKGVGENKYWNLTGNTGTNPATNFIGTTDNVPLILKVNNEIAGKIDHLSLNTSIGYQSLNANTSGSENTAFGHKALFSNRGGSRNTAIGFETLDSNTTGRFNTANGYQSLAKNTSGSYNTANGYQSLVNNTTGSNNTSIGVWSLSTNSTGINNTGVGFQSLLNNLSGETNSAFGVNALFLNTTGNSNTATGFGTLNNNTTGSNNTATGAASLYNNSTGNNNTANGREALVANTTSDFNTAMGYHASHSISTGFQNTSLGANSMVNNTTGSYNTALGYNTGPNSTNLFNTTCIGMAASATADNMVRLGNVFVNSIGGQVGWTTLSDGRFKENIQEDVPGLAFINQLRPVTYRVNRELVNDFTGVNKRKQEQAKENSVSTSTYQPEVLSETTTGFIAQEVEAAAKKIGFNFSGVDAPKNEKDMYGLRYDEFVVPLVKAVQELTRQNEELLKRIEKLEKNKVHSQQLLSAAIVRR